MISSEMATEEWLDVQGSGNRRVAEVNALGVFMIFVHHMLDFEFLFLPNKYFPEHAHMCVL